MSNKCILVTGASSGIGAATALHLAPGNTIFLHYNRSENEVTKVADKVRASGGEAFIVQANLSSESGCKKLYTEVAAHADRLDVLINNAGNMIKKQKIEDYEWSFFQEVFNVNVFSSMKIMSLFLPLLENGTDPNIIFLTSIAARRGAPGGGTIYASAKGALDTLVRGSAKELAPKIRVNAVAPGIVETPFHDKINSDMQKFIQATPLGRNGKVGEIVMGIEFLMNSVFITGETIDINGGLNMR